MNEVIEGANQLPVSAEPAQLGEAETEATVAKAPTCAEPIAKDVHFTSKSQMTYVKNN